MESPYEQIGREAGVLRLVERFYDLMSELPEARTIRAMHAEDLSPMVDKLTVFLTGWMGGPEHYRERFGPVVIPAAHDPYPIGPAERDAWVLCMMRALDDVGASEELIEMLRQPFWQMADMCRTQDD